MLNFIISNDSGEGLIDHRKVIEALKKIKYERAITLEVFTNKKDAKSSANELKLMYS
jgi:sugar phosphate isomerase/epimerase